MISQVELKRLFHYNPDDGLFTRLVTTSNSAKKGTVPKSINKDGYYQVRINYKNYVQHRLAWLYMYGELPCGDIDHINHIRTDNRISNLRVVDKSTNNKNLSKRSNNTSGVTGVWWHRKNKKWCAEIKVDGKKVSLGCFFDKSLATKARLNAIDKYNFHKNHGE